MQLIAVEKEKCLNKRNLRVDILKRGEKMRLGRSLLVVCLVFLGGLNASAQTPILTKLNIPQGGLKIGDKVPEEIWNLPLQVVNHPEGKETITLNEYRGKLIILDFWATWCGTCIESFPKMDAIQSEFKEKIQVFLVNAKQTGDDQQKVNKTFERRHEKAGYTVQLPYILQDTVFSSLFPHRILPHYIWIDKDGVFRSATQGNEMTRTNVQNLLNGHVDMQIKEDAPDLDMSLPVFAKLYTGELPVKYSSILTGYIEGLPQKSGNMSVDSVTNKIYQVNTSLSSMYHTAFRKARGTVPLNQVVFDLPEGNSFKSQYLNPYKFENKYCYELVCPKMPIEQMHEWMQKDLIRAFNVELVADRRKVKSMVLDPTVGLKNIKTTSKWTDLQTEDPGRPMFLHNQLLGTLINLLNHISDTPILIEDKFIKERIDINLPQDIYQFSATDIKSWLEQLGFSIKEEERELDFAVFRYVQ